MGRVVPVGGGSGAGANAGAFGVDASNGSSVANRNIGTHLAVSSANETSPFPSGRICRSNTGW
jgi:hypothetical protein